MVYPVNCMYIVLVGQVWYVGVISTFTATKIHKFELSHNCSVVKKT